MTHFARIATLALSLLLLAGCIKSKEDQAIDQVRNGYLDHDKSAPVGKVFSGYRYFSEQSWNAFETNQGKRVVEFHGKIDLGKHINDHVALLEADAQALVQHGMKGDAFFAMLGNAGLAERLKDPKYAMAAKDLKLSAKILIQFTLLPENQFEVSYIEQRVEADLSQWPSQGTGNTAIRKMSVEDMAAGGMDTRPFWSAVPEQVQTLLNTKERGNRKVLDRIYANRPTPYPAAAMGIYNHYIAAKWR